MQRIINASFKIRNIFEKIISENNNFIQDYSYSKYCKCRSKRNKRLCPKKKKRKCPLDNAEELYKSAPEPIHPFKDQGWGLRKKFACEKRRIFKCEIAQCAIGKKTCTIGPPPCLNFKYVPGRESVDKNTVSGCPKTGWERFYKNLQ